MQIVPFAGSEAPPRFVFSIDVEDYFQVSALESVVPRHNWDALPSRVCESTLRLLDLLDEHQSTATCFVLGWVADRFPWLVREIADRGHEVASHGYWHRRVTNMTAHEFRDDLRQSRFALEQASGRTVCGFRAPSFSITPSSLWAFDVLCEEGFQYDSSVFPIRRSGYGIASAPTDPFRIVTPSGAIDEYPLATVRLGALRIPAAGGGYLRHLPYRLTDFARATVPRGSIGMFYVHPWEIDADQPRLVPPGATRWRHYGGLSQMSSKLARLLSAAPFQSLASARATQPNP